MVYVKYAVLFLFVFVEYYSYLDIFGLPDKLYNQY